MTGLDRLHQIAEDVGRTVWLRDLGAALRDIADGIEGGMRDHSGYESDVMAWVEKNGGLDAVRKRLMPEGMEWLLEVWPKWSNGEYCKFGDWWKADKYGKPEPNQFLKLSIYTPEQLREWGQDDGDHFGYEWDFMRPSDTTYRPDKAEPPEPKVLDADGAPIHEGDTVYEVEGTGHAYELMELLYNDKLGNVESGNPKTLFDSCNFTFMKTAVENYLGQ